MTDKEKIEVLVKALKNAGSALRHAIAVIPPDDVLLGKVIATEEAVRAALVRAAPCPLQTEFGDTVCRNGMLWSLTYSETGPPDSRQAAGECPHCHPAIILALG